MIDLTNMSEEERAARRARAYDNRTEVARVAKLSDDELLKAAQELDAAYAGAADFDAKMLDKWVGERFEQFTKRTDYPKLGWLITQLNERGIASIVHGQSFHAPILYVEKGKLDEAWVILTPVDEMEDDDLQFAGYANEQPDTDLYG